MEKDTTYTNTQSDNNTSGSQPSPEFTTMPVPDLGLPKGGGAIRSIDEKFRVNAVNGSSGLSIGLPFSASRNGFMPGLSLGYDSGSGHSAFGLGWSIGLSSISRRTDKQLPQYRDDTDTFLLSGAEDLVPALVMDDSGNWAADSFTLAGQAITRYRPRTEGGFARIERVEEAGGDTWWRVTDGGNVVTVLGKSPRARLADPASPDRIFRWLPEFSYDDKGNCYRYEYKQEDKVNVPSLVYEKNRLGGLAPFTNTYLKSVKYCNKVHFHAAIPDPAPSEWEAAMDQVDYLLELVLDYGEHDALDPQPADDKGWLCRDDPFSDYRSGFEVRTYRLCTRVLMFHHFAELGAKPCLVSALELGYTSGAAFTFLSSVTQKGYIRKADGTYSVKALPPTEYSYEQPGWDTQVRQLPKASLENLPTGIDDNAYQWTDLYGEGIPGILTEQAGAWYYKSNNGGGEFAPLQLVASKPSLSGLGGALQLQDLEASGQKSLVSHDLQGYYDLDDNDRWMNFQNFASIPGVSLSDPNLRFLDLDGDGRADILISEQEVFTWYPSQGKQGYAASRRIPKCFDEEKGPNIVFADSTQSIILADMSGDGLADIVRIRYSDVSYWPNLGYGRFGARVTMHNAPVFDTPERFNPRYLKLADLDGSGNTGIVYLGHDTFKVYFNRCGNSWSDQHVVNAVNPIPFPKTDAYSSVIVTDLLGNGTACIVWSSPLPQHAGNPLYYIDLMGGKKPHVMISSRNNMGRETYVEYKPSTWFYLQDKKVGTPWVTRLPFPVQCVSRTEVRDMVAKTRFATQYTYHHGYYDHTDREFRGFGRVDQTDTEDFDNYKKHADPDGKIQLVDESFHQPPVLTKTWFHNGAFISNEKILGQFAHEYYQNPALPEKQPVDPPLMGLSTEEWRQALRACKGIPLRTEVYTPDGSDKQHIPYTTTNTSCLIRLLQPRLQQPYAVFQVQQSESLVYSYEREPADPRVAHSMTLETDAFGNVLRAATISYGRKTADASLTPAEQARQGMTHVLFSQNSFTNSISAPAAYRLPAGCENSSWELTGLSPASGTYFTLDEIRAAIGQAAEIVYQALPTAGKKEKRMLSHSKALFLKDDMSGPLPQGQIESLALPYQGYKLALTPGLRDDIFGTRVNNALLINEGKYVHLNDANYWIASGRQTLDAANFYQATLLTDPFGFTTKITYDSTYRYFVQQVTDALGNTGKIAGFNYRTLGAYLLQDPNDNLSGVRSDELGMVTATFTMGKKGEKKGDLMDLATAEASAADRPGTTLEYDLFSYLNTGSPNVTKTTVQETHYYDTLQSGKPSATQLSYGYASGSGGLLMVKKQAEPGLALQENPDGTVSQVDTTPALRWIGNGRTILNNKGKPVKQYEPYFSTTFAFEDSSLLVERGVTPLITYDSAGRVIRTDLPNGTFSRAEFDAWKQLSFDPNDTVTQSQWYADRITSPLPGIATPEEVDAANKATAHAGTPSIAHLDALGRPFINIADNGTEGKHKTFTETDISGSRSSITDARGNLTQQYRSDMLGAQLYSHNQDSGERWNITDVMGKPLRGFDSKGNLFRYTFDHLHRPSAIYVKPGTGTEINTEKIVYGEGQTNDKANNLRAKPCKSFDQAGLNTVTGYDFKGNVLQSLQQLCTAYKAAIDWNTNPALDTAVFSSSSVFDALNRPLSVTSPDGSIFLPVYNRTGQTLSADIRIKGAPEATRLVKEIAYGVKGEREHVIYGNDTKSVYGYDPKTFRVTQLLTTGKNGTDVLQKLSYTYDPVGNITTIKDEAQQTVYFKNAVVSPSNTYTYDALYRLISATGREHIGQNLPPSASDASRINLPQPGDGAALRNYTQSYQYDAVGNILKMIHNASAGGWTRTYNYEDTTNRLGSHTIGSTTEAFTYDLHGNIQNLAQLSGFTWNYKDELQMADLGGGGKAYYVYNGGQRIRKVIERADGSREERIYLGSFELYRKTNSAGVVQEETETLHNIAVIETKTIKEGKAAAEQLIRFQYGNHLGSASLELDNNATIISYEEYYPYGSTSYQAVNADIKAAAKRYRYTGMERDDETGLEYHSARYYLPWLGRWLSADPIGLKGGINLYEYAASNPVGKSDTSGNAPLSDDDIQRLSEESPINVHNDDPSGVRAQTKLGLSDVKTETQWNADRLREYNAQRGHWNSTQIRQYYDSHPGAEAEYWAQNQKNYESYLNKEIGALDHQQKAVSGAALVGNIAAGVVIAAAALFGGAAAFGALKSAVPAGYSLANSTTVLAGGAGGAVVAANKIEEIVEAGGEAIPAAIEAATASSEAAPAAAEAIPAIAEAAPAAAEAAPAATQAVSTAAQAGSNPDVIRVYRFADILDVKTLIPNASKSEAGVAEVAKFVNNAEDLAFRATAHARFGVTENSPFVSLASNLQRLLSSTDSMVRTIITGFPGHNGFARAPYLLTFDVPKNLLFTPTNELSQSETELLFYGDNLIDFLVHAIPNPY